MHLYSENPQKRRHSALIAKQTAEFLAAGGEITKVPSTYFYPTPGYKWIAKKGMDYTSWDRHGALYYKDLPANAGGYFQAGDGCYVTKPAPTSGRGVY